MSVRKELAACYRMFARRGMDDLIYTHLSARLPEAPDRYLFIPFGMLFEEVTASNLIEVDIAGKDLSGSGKPVRLNVPSIFTVTMVWPSRSTTSMTFNVTLTAKIS